MAGRYEAFFLDLKELLTDIRIKQSFPDSSVAVKDISELAELKNRSWSVSYVETLAPRVTVSISTRALAGICDNVVVGVYIQAKSSPILHLS